MTDADLAAKFHGLVDPILGSGRADELVARSTELASAPDVRAIARLAAA
jgi:hypothetical protein